MVFSWPCRWTMIEEGTPNILNLSFKYLDYTYYMYIEDPFWIECVYKSVYHCDIA